MVVSRFCKVRADEAILLLLNHRNHEVSMAAAGVLVNMSGHMEFFDNAVMSSFSLDSSLPTSCKVSATLLSSILRKSSLKDISFMTLILQV